MIMLDMTMVERQKSTKSLDGSESTIALFSVK